MINRQSSLKRKKRNFPNILEIIKLKILAILKYKEKYATNVYRS